jgi:hypothetical protein
MSDTDPNLEASVNGSELEAWPAGLTVTRCPTGAHYFRPGDRYCPDCGAALVKRRYVAEDEG